MKNIFFYALYNAEAEKDITQEVSYAQYIPEAKEEHLWSRTIKVPRKIFPRLCYRVREDYYKVLEMYTDPEIIPPDMRLVGTDVIVHHVDSTGRFAHVWELETGIKHKIFFKFLRMLQPGEVLVQNRWVFRTGRTAILPKKLLEDYTKGTPRFKVELRGSLGILTMYRTSLNMLENNRRLMSAVSSTDLCELLLEAIVWVIEDRGYLNPAELQLYNDIILDRTFENLFVQEVLNESTWVGPQVF